MEGDHAALRRILGGADWEVVECATCQEARSLLRAHKIPVVIGGASLGERDWKSVLAETCRQPDAPKLILSAHPSNQSLWTEALRVGCYDILAWPYTTEEVLRVAVLACDRWKRDCEGHVAEAKPPTSAFSLTDTRYRTRIGSVR